MRVGRLPALTLQLISLDILSILSYTSIAAEGNLTHEGRNSAPGRSVAGLAAGLLGLIWCPADFMLASGDGIQPAWMCQ